ncbi:MAG: hypothetical protein B7Z37_21140 [Verrucomicrobia bacterium 12-59-8]|nr:MAG: hypothetical protein B7Z37_21140 [Verrucomicrobia bacterium 12-59-8]
MNRKKRKNKDKERMPMPPPQSSPPNASAPLMVSQVPAPAKADFHSQSPTFVIEEYKRLCAEIDSYDKESTNCVNYSIAATAAFWAWWVTAPHWIVTSPFLLIPAVLTLVWLLRWASFQTSMAGIGKYLQESEAMFLPKTHGWETHLRKVKNRSLMASKGRWAAVYFTILILANLAIAAAVFILAPKEDPSHAKAVKTAAESLISAMTDHVQKSAAQPVANPPQALPATPAPDSSKP